VEAVTLHCRCGHGILCEVQPEGERIGFLAFFDDEPTSETYAQRIKSCPVVANSSGCLCSIELTDQGESTKPRGGGSSPVLSGSSSHS
jgi:hypothetical protein